MATSVLWRETTRGYVRYAILQGVLRVTGYGQAEPPLVGYFVSVTDGDDANDGSLEAPFRTITRGIAAASPGDTVYVREGEYTERVLIDKSGLPGQPITLQVYPGERAIIDGGYLYPEGDYAFVDPVSGNGFVYTGLVQIVGSHITLDGFTVKRSRGRALRVGVSNTPHSGSGITVRNCVFEDNRSAAIHLDGYDDALIEANSVWHSSDYCQYRRGTSLPWPGSILAKYCDDVTIRGNTSYENYGEGILLAGCNRCLVEDNIVYDNMSTNMFLNTCSEGIVQRNLVYYTGPDPSRGISLGLDYDIDPGTAFLTDNTVINNIVVGCYFNFSFHVYTGGGTDPGGRGALINTLIAHNTLVNAKGTPRDSIWQPTAIWIRSYADHDNVRIQNNIFLQDPALGVLAYVPVDDAFTLSHNLWSSAPPSHVSGPGDVVGNPRLVNPGASLVPGSVDPEWYRLASGSPAIGAGTVLAQVTDDFWRTIRDASPDMGAHEYR
jgi:parallel beta-helix repeat protein